MINFEKLSPMMKQYFRVKEQHQDVILLYRLGDFYEMFFDDAIKASKELDLILTGRDCGLENRAPMCGIPHHAAEGYIARLVEKGYKVGICEQMSEPGQGKIVEREIVRVVTKGTVTEQTMLSDEKNNYLASIYFDNEAVGVSWADISTGEFNHAYIEAPIAMRLNDLLARIEPSEIICNSLMLERSIDLSVVKFGGVCPFSAYSDDAFNFNNALEVVKAQLEEPAIKALLANKLCVNSAGALIDYIYATQKRSLNYIKDVNFDTLDEIMQIDSVARRTLELTSNVMDGGKNGTLLQLVNKTSTGMGKRLLKKWIEQPILNVATINQRLDCIEAFQNDIFRDNIKAILNNINDIERLGAKLSCGDIRPRELLMLGQSLLNISQLKDAILGVHSNLLYSLNEQIDDFKNESNLICSAIKADEKLSNNIADGDIIASGFDEELDRLRNIDSNIANILLDLERSEKEETGIRGLKIAFNRVFGYYIEVPKSQIELVPYRYDRKQTVASGERYTTDELKKLESQITSAKEDVLKREIQIYKMLVEELKKTCNNITKAANAIAYVDCLVSLGKIARDYHYTRPSVSDDIDHIKIIDGRHPIVERYLNNESFVPNDTHIDSCDNKVMIITGPNMAGKSVYMRQVALITILAHIGSYVPAKHAEIAVTDRIFTRIGASDDLSTGRSTFMVEMSEVSNILANVTPKSLVLLDEIGRGTSTYDGLSIAWSIIEHLANNCMAKVLFSTHYHEITDLEGLLKGVKNYKLTLKEVGNTIVFLRKLLRGSSNRSFGIEVAGLAGLPKQILSRSKEILKLLENADIGKQQDLIINNNKNSISKPQNNSLNEIISIISDIDTDCITPRNALDILVDLKEKVTLNG